MSVASKEKATHNVNDKPKVLDFYNKKIMGGVDFAGIMVSHYCDDRKL